MEVTYTITGLKELTADLDDLARNQLPFGTAKALTQTAVDAQQEIIRQLPQRFTIRTSWYKSNMKYGIKTKMATKADQTSAVYTEAPWMILQETGGTRLPSGKMLAVPTTFPIRVIPRGQRPKGLLASGSGWIGKDRAGSLVVFKRTGKTMVRVPFVLKTQAKIPARFGMIQTAINVVDQKWKTNFYIAMAAAIGSAK